MHFDGLGVTQDYAEALKWYKLAATQGQVEAQGNLGNIYAFGLWVPKDYNEALKWYKFAADQGNAVAQNGPGNMYVNGQGVSRDEKKLLSGTNWQLSKA